MRRRFTSAEMRRAALHWVVSLDFGGRTWRVAQSALSIESTDAGRWISVAAGLDGAETEAAAPWMGSDAEARRASVEVVLPGLDVGATLAAGYELDNAPLEVAIWRFGDTWENRLVVVSGRVTGYEWGAVGEPIAIEAAETVDEDRATLPPAGSVVGARSWPTAPGDAPGRAYPWILGAPGSDGTPASPAIFVETISPNVLLVAGHPVTATSVLISDGTSTESLLIEHRNDGARRTVAYVDLDTSTTLAIDTELTYSAAWTGGAGLAGPLGDGSGAGTVLAAVLSRSTLRIDLASLAAIQAELDAWKIGAYIEEPISPMAWVADALLPILPVAALVGPDGWRLVLVPVDPVEADCIGRLTAGPGVVRVDRVRSEGDPVNRLELRYRVAAEGGDTQAAVVAGVDADAGEHPSTVLHASASTYGLRADSMESVAVYEEATALRIVRYLSSLSAFPRQRAAYSGPDVRWMQPGDLVWVTDSALSLARVAWVEKVTLSPETATVEVVFWRANG